MKARNVLVATVGCLVLIAAPLTTASAAPTIEDDIVVTSFDDTPIVATLMLPEGASAANPVPVILKTHGWGGTREVAPAGVTERLLNKGYAIFTWDARGFGQSGGEANIDSPEFEVKDTIKLIDYLATRPEIQKDAPGDIRAGWIGVSYAGGIQLNTSAFDHRVDALVPEIPWADLVQDLFPNGVVKRSWDQLLYGAGAASATTEGIGSPAGPQTGVYAQQIHQAQAEGTSTGSISQPIQDWFYDKSTVIRSHLITVPTMIMQGTVDTLFPLEDGYANYLNLVKRARVPAKLVTFCGGHTLGCNYPGGATGDPSESGEFDHYDDLIVNWIDYYVKGDKSVDIGPALEWQAQTGHYYGASKYPAPGTKNLRTKQFSTGPLAGPGESGGDQPASGAPAPEQELGATAARERVLAKSKRARAIIGIPKVRLRGTVTGAEAAYVFFELVDRAPDGTLVTLDDQTMPLKLVAGDVRGTVALHGVSWLVQPKHTVFLEITTGSTQYDTARTGPYTVDLKARTTLPLTRKGVRKGDRTA